MLNNKNIVITENLSFYRKNKIIFSNLNMNIKIGNITCIIGPSGAGKTTLLKLICGQLKPNKGIIRIDDTRIDNINVLVNPMPDDNQFEATIIFDIIGQEFPTQEYSFILEATR